LRRPESFSIQGASFPNVAMDTLEDSSQDWPELLPRMQLEADAEHRFSEEIVDLGPITHVRLNIYPDGGVSRLRLLAAG
ncbi:MAG: allantoicase, partial [Gammaproteobacteria bacterium]|nr:allantoicase [Gammaproteobacteria bacterium]